MVVLVRYGGGAQFFRSGIVTLGDLSLQRHHTIKRCRSDFVTIFFVQLAFGSVVPFVRYQK